MAAFPPLAGPTKLAVDALSQADPLRLVFAVARFFLLRALAKTSDGQSASPRC